MINEACHVCFLSHTCEGKASDKSMAELAGYTLPSGSCLYQDKGFQGFFLQGITIFQPKKTPRGGGVKRYRIVKDTIRLLKDGIRDTVMETCCGLHNFRLQYRPWHYAS